MRKRPVCAIAICFLLYQLFCVWWFPEEAAESPLQKYEGETVAYVGTVGRREETTDYHIYYLEEIQNAPFSGQLSDQKLLIYVKKPDENELLSLEKGSGAENSVCVGNVIRITGRVSLFDNVTNPGMFDQKAYYAKQGIVAMLWAENVMIVENHADWLQETLTCFRLAWQEQLIRILGEKNGQLLSAMLLGDKRDMDAELKEIYQVSGIGHVLAISGLHMSFLGNGLYDLLRRRGAPFLAAGLAGCTFLSLYALMIGGGVSAFRALIMYMVRMGAEITGRTYDQATSLAIAAGVIVAMEPLYLTDAGFLLSFGAILGILLFEPVLKGLWGQWNRNPRKQNRLFNGVIGSLSIHLMLFPIMLYFYYEFPTYSIFLNLLVIPLMSVVLGTGMLASVCLGVGTFSIHFLTAAGEWILKICSFLLELYEMLAKNSIQLPFSRVILGQPKMWQMVVYYLALAAGYGICRGYLKRKEVEYQSYGNENANCQKGEVDESTAQREKTFMYRAFQWGKRGVVCSAFYLMSILLFYVGHGTNGNLEVTMLDVGQGDCILFCSPDGLTCMVDGGSSDVSSVGRYRIETYLKSQGISKLDYVFVTHGDEDHCNGILEMLKRQEMGIRIEKLVLPKQCFWDEMLYNLAQTAQAAGVSVVTIDAGEMLLSGECSLSCIQPASDDAIESGNAASLVLKLSYGEFDMLLTGDVEDTGEDLLTKRLMGTDFEVLKVAHHGSKNSSSEAFLERVNAEIALISAGRNNRYGHPHEETLERLNESGSKVISTQENGAIVIRTDGEKMWVK